MKSNIHYHKKKHKGISNTKITFDSLIKLKMYLILKSLVNMKAIQHFGQRRTIQMRKYTNPWCVDQLILKRVNVYIILNDMTQQAVFAGSNLLCTMKSLYLHAIDISTTYIRPKSFWITADLYPVFSTHSSVINDILITVCNTVSCYWRGLWFILADL
jgi:hypothetical protein